MWSKLKTSIVRIFKENGKIAGTGFLVDSTSVLSCTHVINEALGSSEDILERPMEKKIHLDFPLVDPGNKLTAHVVSGESMQQSDDGDIALLCLDSPPPEGANIARLVITENDDLWGHKFRTFGFPELYADGVSAYGKLLDRQASGLILIVNVEQTGYRVQPGFSGGPIWDEQLNGVVGMVVAAEKDPTIRAAYAIPAKTLVKTCPSLEKQASPPCPYRGLSAFREQDAMYFFGRERFVDKLVYEVLRRHSHLTIIIGSSGSGKSSVIYAGLLPRLHQLETLHTASFRPGSQPFHALASILQPMLEPGMTETDRLLEKKKLATLLIQKDLSTQDIIGRIVQKNQEINHIVLIIDQFEEVYTLCSEASIRSQFLDTLLSMIDFQGNQRPLMTLVLTLRADFMGQALVHRSFADAIQDGTLILKPMAREELKEAIEKPAEKVNVIFESGLVERILADIEEEPGALPLLEFALTLLWEYQENKHLTHRAYEAIGRVEGALARYADEIYDELQEDEKEQVRRLFVQMVRPGDGTEDTRRIATHSELGEESWTLIRRLADTRLVVTNVNSLGLEIAEIVHEALIQKWDRLGEWMEADRAFRVWQEKFRVSLDQWEQSSRNKDVLLRGILLNEAKPWLEKRNQELSFKEREYLFHSILSEGIDLLKWLPLCGKMDEIFSFLNIYRNAPDEANRLKCIEALRWLPASEREEEIYLILKQFIIDDISSIVRNRAALAIIERHQTHYVNNLLISKDLSRKENRRLIQSLAFVRNLPNIGLIVESEINSFKKRIFLASLFQIISAYQKQIYFITSLLFIFTVIPGVYALGQKNSINFNIYIPLDIKYILYSVALIIIGLTIFIYFIIRYSFIDKKKIRILHRFVIASCLGIIGVIVRVKILNLLGYDTTFNINSLYTDLDSYNAYAWITSSIVILLFLSLITRIKFNKFFIFKLLLIAILSFGSEIVINWIVFFATFIYFNIKVFPSRNISYDLAILFGLEHFFRIQSLFGTLIIGILITFICLLCLLFAFRSVFYGQVQEDHQNSSRHEISLLTNEIVLTEQQNVNRSFSHFGLINLVLLVIAASVILGSIISVVLIFSPIVVSPVSTIPSFFIKADSVEWSPDKQRVASVDIDGTVRVWDGPSGRTFVIKYSYSNSGKLIWSNNGEYVAFIDADGTVLIWDSVFKHSYIIYQVAGQSNYVNVEWSPDGTRLAVSDRTMIKVISAATRRLLFTYYSQQGYYFYAQNVKWSPDGTHLAVNDRTIVEVMSAATGKPFFTYHSYLDSSGFFTRVNDVEWSVDGTRLAMSYGTIVEVINAATGKPFFTYHSYLGNYFYAQNLKWSPDGALLAVSDGTIVAIWSTANRNLLYIHQNQGDYSDINWSPDSNLLAVTISTGNENILEVWNAISGKQLYTYKGYSRSDLIWSPDSTRLAAILNSSKKDNNENIVEVWDPINAKSLIIYKGHFLQINAIAWSPDGKRIASVSDDRTLQVWEAATGDIVHSFYNHAVPIAVSWSSDGKRLLSLSNGGIVQTWNI